MSANYHGHGQFDVNVYGVRQTIQSKLVDTPYTNLAGCSNNDHYCTHSYNSILTVLMQVRKLTERKTAFPKLQQQNKQQQQKKKKEKKEKKKEKKNKEQTNK